VDYEYAEQEKEAEEAPLDLSEIRVPDEMVERIRGAAELSSVTELEGTLDEMRELGEAEAKLADRLRVLSQNFRMDEILRVLGELG
jgi:hypothetical protein